MLPLDQILSYKIIPLDVSITMAYGVVPVGRGLDSVYEPRDDLELISRACMNSDKLELSAHFDQSPRFAKIILSAPQLCN